MKGRAETGGGAAQGRNAGKEGQAMGTAPDVFAPGTAPAVFAVGDRYQIIAETAFPSLFSVKVGDDTYFDAANGIMRSMCGVHRVSVPMAALDGAKAYTVRVTPIVERKPYFTRTGDTAEIRYPFYPVPEKNVRAYHIADCHNLTDEPVAAAGAFGAFDFLILNGDVIDHSSSPDKFANIYRICARLTGGSRPVVFSRGNHDMRGEYAERFADYTPNDRGNTFYSFRLGSVWGVVLDCGEDKEDGHPEYGLTVACHSFRLRQTAFLKALVQRAEEEFRAPGVATRIVIAHIPFTEKFEPPFCIEEDVYRAWCALLKEHIKPHLMLFGHTHKMEVRLPGGPKDGRGQPCPAVIASELKENKYWAGCGMTFRDGGADLVFTDCLGAEIGRESVSWQDT